MEKLIILIIFIFDGIKDIIDTWLDKKLSLWEKIDDTIFDIICTLFFTALIICAWKWIDDKIL